MSQRLDQLLCAKSAAFPKRFNELPTVAGTQARALCLDAIFDIPNRDGRVIPSGQVNRPIVTTRKRRCQDAAFVGSELRNILTLCVEFLDEVSTPRGRRMMGVLASTKPVTPAQNK